MSNTEQNVTVKLQTNIEPVTATIEEGVDWIEAVDTRAMIDKEFSFKVLANTEGGPRDATIIFKNADASEHIVIKQAGKELTYPAVIPDKVLKTYIMTNFDTNKDGEISKEEAEAVKAIELYGVGDRIDRRSGIFPEFGNGRFHYAPFVKGRFLAVLCFEGA